MTSVGQKLVTMLLWAIVSVVVSCVLGGLGSHTDLLGGGHARTVAACAVPPGKIDVRLRDVGGLAAIKEELYYALLLPLRHPAVFFGGGGPLASTRGLLLTGPPGCGKTMLMRAVARECGCTFLCPQLSQLMSKYYGESQKMLAAVFDVARRSAPCIVFLDEIDAAFRTRDAEDAGADYAFKTEFLQLLDGVGTDRGSAVVVVGATNCPDKLDPALKRRLPNVLRVGLPDAAERRHIVTLQCRRERAPAECMAQFDEALDAAATDGLSGSDLAELYRASSRLRLREALRPGVDVERVARALPPLRAEHWRAAREAMRTAQRSVAEDHCDAGRAERLLRRLQRA